MGLLRFSVQVQNDTVSDAVRARYAMIIPILRAMLLATKGQNVDWMGGPRQITLEQFATIYKEGDGDYGICFEFAVHEAIRNRDRTVYPLLSTALEDFCHIKGGAESILFGAEKSGRTDIITSAEDVLTDESLLLTGRTPRGAPRLRPLITDLVKAHRGVKGAKGALPTSIRDTWRADLFIGSPAPDHWVATTLKIDRRAFTRGRGLRIGMYPEPRRGIVDPHVDDKTNLVMVPLPYSSDFMELFGSAFQIVKHLVAARGRMPSRVALVRDDDYRVAEWLHERRYFPVVDILEALEPIKQPGILTPDDFLEAFWEDWVNGRPAPPENLRDLWNAVAPVPRIR